MMAHELHLTEFSAPSNPILATGAYDHNHELLAFQDGYDIRDFYNRSNISNASAMVTKPMSNTWQANDAATLRSLSLSLFNTRGVEDFGQVAAQPMGLHQSLASSPSSHLSMQQHPFHLRISRYLSPAKELLNEFCSLGGDMMVMSSKKRSTRTSKGEEVEGSSSSSLWTNPNLTSMDFLELERRKARLYTMVEEVDRRYRRYREQMRSIELSFEAVAGESAARVYLELASRAMSKHFRCLRDAIVGQIRATRKAMGEKDNGAVSGTTKGDTPRLRLLDQCLRQQRAFQQGGAAENFPWRPQRGLPERSVSTLRAWLFEHFLNPYPSDVDKHILARQTGLSRSQVSNWFINARVRLWKPMIEDMYAEEIKQQEGHQSSHAGVMHQGSTSQSPNPNLSSSYDQKPAASGPQLPANSNSLISSIIDNNAAANQLCGYTNLAAAAGAVSLTLGLQQHRGAGSGLSFGPSATESFMLSREQVDDGQPVHFSILDGEEEALPYTNLMGSQLLHDLQDKYI